jgi:hypothetical protein
VLTCASLVLCSEKGSNESDPPLPPAICQGADGERERAPANLGSSSRTLLLSLAVPSFSLPSRRRVHRLSSNRASPCGGSECQPYNGPMEEDSLIELPYNLGSFVMAATLSNVFDMPTWAGKWAALLVRPVEVAAR